MVIEQPISAPMDLLGNGSSNGNGNGNGNINVNGIGPDGHMDGTAMLEVIQYLLLPACTIY